MALGICGRQLIKLCACLKNGPATVVADNAHHATEFSNLGRRATVEAMSQETDRPREHHILRGKGVRRMRCTIRSVDRAGVST